VSFQSNQSVFAGTIFRCTLLLVGAISATAVAEDSASEEKTVRHQVTGLFSPDRVDDLREVLKNLPEITLVSVDFETAEGVFRYNPATAFPNTRPEQIVERFDQKLRQVSRATFGIKPLCTTPRDQLQRIEIRIAGLDCKGCSLAAYEAVYRIEGVENATASFRDGLVTAWIHPDKVDRAALEEALTKKGVKLIMP